MYLCDIVCYNDKLDLTLLSWIQLCYVECDYAMLDICWDYDRYYSILDIRHDYAILNVVSYVCLFDLILYVPSTIFQSNRDGSSGLNQY